MARVSGHAGAFAPPLRGAPTKAAAAPGARVAVAVPAGNGRFAVLDIAELLYRKGSVRDFALAIEIHKGVITMPRLEAILPGDMVLSPTARRAGDSRRNPPILQQRRHQPRGPNLRETLTWLEIDTSGMPRTGCSGWISTASSPRPPMACRSRSGRGSRWPARDGQWQRDLWHTICRRATLQPDRFDIDAYLPAPPPAAPIVRCGRKAATPPAASPAPAPARVPAGAAAARQDGAGVRAEGQVAKLVFREETLGGVDGDASVQGNLLKLNGLKIADLLGGKIDLIGSVTDFGAVPRFDVTFNATLPDPTG